jgi:hypothetical protein
LSQNFNLKSPISGPKKGEYLKGYWFTAHYPFSETHFVLNKQEGNTSSNLTKSTFRETVGTMPIDSVLSVYFFG